MQNLFVKSSSKLFTFCLICLFRIIIDLTNEESENNWVTFKNAKCPLINLFEIKGDHEITSKTVVALRNLENPFFGTWFKRHLVTKTELGIRRLFFPNLIECDKIIWSRDRWFYILFKMS